MSGPRLASPRAQRGVTWVGLLLLVAAVIGAYLVWVWAPIYFENYEVKQVVRDYMNQAVKNPDDERLRHNMVLKLRSLAQVESLDAHGQAVRLPAVAVNEHEVTWERDSASQPPVLRVSFEYAREVSLPILGSTATKVFTVDLSNDLTLPDWGPAR